MSIGLCSFLIYFILFTVFCLIMYSPIRSLIEAGFNADKRSDVRLYYGARNVNWMAYQVLMLSFIVDDFVHVHFEPRG